MTSLLKKVPTPLILVAVLGGCTAITEGPKFLWGANVEQRASEMGRVCLGKSRLGHIANPITWFLTPPHAYWFANSDKVGEQKYSKGIWIVQSYGVNREKGQWATLSMIDVNKERWAYLGDVESDSEKKVADNFDKPDWKNIKDLKYDAWISNAMDWIRNGKPSSANYCE